MIELGKRQRLKVLRLTTVGVFIGIGDEDEKGGILMPKKYVAPEVAVGDEVEAFIYRDSEDRLVATTEHPALQVGRSAS